MNIIILTRKYDDSNYYVCPIFKFNNATSHLQNKHYYSEVLVLQLIYSVAEQFFPQLKSQWDDNGRNGNCTAN